MIGLAAVTGLAAGALAEPAFAAPPSHDTFTQPFTLTSQACAFPVVLEGESSVRRTTFLAVDGTVSRRQLHVETTTTATNPATGKTLTSTNHYNAFLQVENGVIVDRAWTGLVFDAHFLLPDGGVYIAFAGRLLGPTGSPFVELGMPSHAVPADAAAFCAALA